MLMEFQGVRQINGEGKRRWFFDDFFDLIVWYDSTGEIEGFQLCYDKESSERALTWKRGQGYSHNKIDDGEVPFGAKMTPILVRDGFFDRDGISRKFETESKNIPEELRKFVIDILSVY